jgi:hypothetical protein
LIVVDTAGFELVDERVQGFFVLPIALESAVVARFTGVGVIEGLDSEGVPGL